MNNQTIENEAGERRFQGHMSEEYLIVMQGIPHLAEMDRHVQEAIIGYRGSEENQPLKVLEVGCGPGRATAKIIASRPGLNLVAIDSEPKLAVQARRYLSEAVDDGILSIVEADALAYLQTSPDNHFDIVVEVLCLHNLELDYRNQVLQEIYRTLKPGGLLIAADKFPPDDPMMFSKLLQDHIGLFVDGIAPSGRFDLLKEVVLHELADFSPERIMKKQESLQIMMNLGFQNCRFIFRRNFDCVFLANK